MDQFPGERGLWAAVVLRARDDILGADYVELGSVDYDAAVAFFTAPGDWAISRQNIADCLGVHVDDITRLGRAAIDASRVKRGLAPLPVEAPKPKPVRRARVPLKSPSPPTPLPKLEATFAKPKRVISRPAAGGRGGRPQYIWNPFDPNRRKLQPSVPDPPPPQTQSPTPQAEQAAARGGTRRYVWNPLDPLRRKLMS